MNYVIVYDDSADYHSANRRQTRVAAEQLASKITRLQAAGKIIYAVRQSS